jgi:2-polyprenyl-3-methyl-5-hydroxy-6-metoxy-1,4-benzoquinol methylase
MSAIDPDKLKMFSFLLFTKLEGAVTSGMVHLGDQLGLYTALAKSTQPMTSAQLAHATELNERWVREWAYNQASSRLISTTNTPSASPSIDDDQFFLSPEQAAVLADPNSPAFGMGMFHRLPQTMAALNKMPESFRTGIGHDYDSHGPEGAVGIERSFEPWTNANLIDTVIPAINGISETLASGGTVADIGCGAGSAILLMGRNFPKSSFVGYDISQYALDRAADKLNASGLKNVSFQDPRNQPLPTNNSIDFITTFDCIHDMTHPAEMMQAIRKAIKPNGTWLLVDIKAHDTFALNAQKNPMAPLMYGISVLSCMSSAMSSPDGAGLGTLGFSANTAEAMAKDAGFSRFARLDVDHSINAFYEIRP